ncbi:polyprenyl synthetase family protein [Oxalobacteraceae bacterium CAVE-383]|nr:polyprenyl synthetase family protein [Oxalobacteraceae bacterium CAVE-383]
MSAVERALEAVLPEAEFSVWMKRVQEDIETALDHFLTPSGTVPARLHEAMRYAVLGGGKRVRPLLVFGAGSLFDAPPPLLARAAAALEMIHVYSLVHDDMPCMDDDALRRGKPTVHVQYDEATALLVGDALQAQAFWLLSEPGGLIDPARQLAMVNLLAQAAGSLGMCGGQAIDLASVGLQLSLPQLEQMHRLKTGALLRAAVLLGASCGSRLTPPQHEALERYAGAVGLAFQVVDDILDGTADSATLGKTAGKDAVDNKPTYVSILGLEQSRVLALKLRDDAHQALQPFGDGALRLRQLADLIVRRQA